MGRHTREQANELRAVAPLVVIGDGAGPVLVGPCLVVASGERVIACSSAEILRRAGEPLAIAVTLDGRRTVPVASWALARASGLGLIELAEPFPREASLDVEPLDVAAVSATVETRGAPSGIAIVTAAEPGGFSRRLVPVHVDVDDQGGMRDRPLHLASPQDVTDVDLPAEGAPVFAWLPADAVLGRAGEIVAVALALPYRAHAAKPRDLPVIAELVALEDVGRALPLEGQEREGSNDLSQVAGEIMERS